VVNRINRMQNDQLKKTRETAGIQPDSKWKVVISPHDDYTYVGYLYPAALHHVKVKIIILFGVAHKARKLNLQDQIIFDDFPAWQGAYGPIKISPLRQDIIDNLAPDTYQINNEMQAVEHSVEALLPFLQYYNRNIEIVSILVPYISYDRMDEIAFPLAEAIDSAVKKRNWQWGKDFAFVISNDAVHYGDEDWGGKNFAYFGADSSGYQKAVQHEMEIINTCLIDNISPDKIKRFTQFTVEENDYKKYKWTWCGRYSVPFGLLTAHYLQSRRNIALKGQLIGYSTSIDHEHIPVDDLNLGVTAPANIRHWVGYAAVGYK